MRNLISNILGTAVAFIGFTVISIDSKVNAKKHAARHADDLEFERVMNDYQK